MLEFPPVIHAIFIEIRRGRGDDRPVGHKTGPTGQLTEVMATDQPTDLAVHDIANRRAIIFDARAAIVETQIVRQGCVDGARLHVALPEDALGIAFDQIRGYNPTIGTDFIDAADHRPTRPTDGESALALYRCEGGGHFGVITSIAHVLWNPAVDRGTLGRVIIDDRHVRPAIGR